MGEFMYPSNNKASEATIYDQALKVVEEAEEVKVAAEEADDWQILTETYDVIHTCEGILRKYPKELRQKAHDHVRAKCKARGDYETK